MPTKKITKKSVVKKVQKHFAHATTEDPGPIDQTDSGSDGSDETTFSKLRDGGWGIRGFGFVEGQMTDVKKKDGSSDSVKVDRILWTDEATGLQLASFEQQERKQTRDARFARVFQDPKTGKDVWGIRIGSPIKSGQTVMVRRKDGTMERVVVVNVKAEDDGFYKATVRRTRPANGVRSTTPVAPSQNNEDNLPF